MANRKAAIMNAFAISLITKMLTTSETSATPETKSASLMIISSNAILAMLAQKQSFQRPLNLPTLNSADARVQAF